MTLNEQYRTNKCVCGFESQNYPYFCSKCGTALNPMPCRHYTEESTKTFPVEVYFDPKLLRDKDGFYVRCDECGKQTGKEGLDCAIRCWNMMSR